MGRRDEDKLAPAPLGCQYRGTQTVFIHRDRPYLRPCCFHHSPRRPILRFFQQYRIARINQHARGEIERLLRTVEDDDLFGCTSDGPCTPEICSYRLAQCCQSFRRAVVEVAHRRPPGTSAPSAAEIYDRFVTPYVENWKNPDP